LCGLFIAPDSKLKQLFAHGEPAGPDWGYD